MCTQLLDSWVFTSVNCCKFSINLTYCLESVKFSLRSKYFPANFQFWSACLATIGRAVTWQPLCAGLYYPKAMSTMVLFACLKVPAFPRYGQKIFSLLLRYRYLIERVKNANSRLQERDRWKRPRLLRFSVHVDKNMLIFFFIIFKLCILRHVETAWSFRFQAELLILTTESYHCRKHPTVNHFLQVMIQNFYVLWLKLNNSQKSTLE